jgi:hypothetical protein
MRLTMRLRVHEWLAERVRWVQYPDLQAERRRQLNPNPSLWFHYKRMTWKQLGWFWFWVFWGGVSLLAFTGPRG